MKPEGYKEVRLHPGEYHVDNGQVAITTLLGSCVSACLYDPIRRIVGMNHFLLSNRRYAKEMPYSITEAGRYGIYAMELVINEMLKLGALKANMRAKAFGGGAVMSGAAGTDNFFCVGDVNSRFITDFLKNEGIPLLASDLGGDKGRVIHFYSDDYSVYVRKIKKAENFMIIESERQYWKRSIEEHDKGTPEPDIWI